MPPNGSRVLHVPSCQYLAIVRASISSRHRVNARASAATNTAVPHASSETTPRSVQPQLPKPRGRLGTASTTSIHSRPENPCPQPTPGAAPFAARQREIQYAFPRAETGQSVSTLPFRIPTYQSWMLQVGSQWPGTRRSRSWMPSTFCGSRMIPCSSEHLT